MLGLFVSDDGDAKNIGARSQQNSFVAFFFPQPNDRHCGGWLSRKRMALQIPFVVPLHSGDSMRYRCTTAGATLPSQSDLRKMLELDFTGLTRADPAFHEYQSMREIRKTMIHRFLLGAHRISRRPSVASLWETGRHCSFRECTVVVRVSRALEGSRQSRDLPDLSALGHSAGILVFSCLMNPNVR
jgi:hypothetical protein